MAHFLVPSSRSVDFETPELIYLHERVVAGLEVSSELSSGRCYGGVVICLQHDRIGNQWGGPAGFLASLPVFPAFTGLFLEGADGDDVFNITSIPAKFPSLNSLVIDIIETASHSEVICEEGHNLVSVRCCSALEHLSLHHA